MDVLKTIFAWKALKWVLIGLVVLLVILALGNGADGRTGEVKNEKVNICHATESEKNPYNAIRVADDGDWNGHQKHEGDFLYEGPVDDKDRPTKDGDQWCEDNTPDEPGGGVNPTPPPPTPTPTPPTPTPTPSPTPQSNLTPTVLPSVGADGR